TGPAHRAQVLSDAGRCRVAADLGGGNPAAIPPSVEPEVVHGDTVCSYSSDPDQRDRVAADGDLRVRPEAGNGDIGGEVAVTAPERRRVQVQQVLTAGRIGVEAHDRVVAEPGCE